MRQCRTFALDELRELEQVEEVIDVHCVTRWSKPQVRFRGVPLAALLQQAEPQPAGQFVSFVARTDREHSTSLKLADALALGTLVALGVDGAPLGVERGGPVRIVVPGRYFYKSLKWLEQIEILAKDRLGFWERTAGYHNTADPWREQRYIASGLSAAEARQILASRNISRRDLLGLRAEGRDLAGLAAQHALLRDADFRGCNLRAARFDHANLSNARFAQADLRDARFDHADLEGADFCQADLRGACLAGASLMGASFSAGLDAETCGARIDAATRLDPASIAVLAPEQQDYLRVARQRAGGNQS